MVELPEVELRPGDRVVITAGQPVQVVAPIILLKSNNPLAWYAVRDARARGFAWWVDGALNGKTLTRPAGYTFDVFGERQGWLIAFRSADGRAELVTKGFWLGDRNE